MKEDNGGDATESQRRCVAGSQSLLMMHSCRDDVEGVGKAHPLLTLPVPAAVA